MRIVIHGDTLASWSGGTDLLKLLVRALADRDHTLYLLIKGDARPPSFLEKNFRSLVRVWYRWFSPPAPSGLGDLPDTVRMVTYAYRRDEVIARLKPDVILPCMDQPGKIPTVAYLYDCQHRHYPEFFTSQEIAARDRTFRTLLDHSKSAIVTSEDAKRDLLHFYPESGCEITALPFTATLGDSWLTTAAERLGVYQLPPRYFVISNQFWVHKDHLTAFQALAELVVAGNDMHLVCTGKMTDPRAPGHPEQLVQWIADHGLEDRIHLLGYIDKRDQIEILKNTVALIQPTLFEGLPGGLAVADALSLGCRVIVSDLPVNRELPQGPRVRYFPPKDAARLAEEMKRAWDEDYQRPTDTELLEQQKRSIEAMSFALYRAIERAMA